jgi:hypothetical protein
VSSELISPICEDFKSMHQQDNTNEESDGSPKEVSIVSNAVPPPPANNNSSKCAYQTTPWWKNVAEVIGIAAVVWYACITHGMWTEMQTTNTNTLTAFRIDERAWVGLEPMKPVLKSPADAKFPAMYTYDLNAINTGKTVARCVEIRIPRQAAVGSIANSENEEMIKNWQDNFLLGKFQNSADIPIIRSAPKVLSPGEVTPVALQLAGQVPIIYPSGNELVATSCLINTSQPQRG